MIDNVPVGYLSSHILQIVGEGLYTEDNIKTAFSNNGRLNSLEIIGDTPVILITAQSQQTGVDQHLFCLKNTGQTIDVDQLAVFVGNYLDIDNWVSDNFSMNENIII